MARRRSGNRLDSALDKWAIWCHSGGVLPTTGRSMLAKLIDNKGEIFFGGAPVSSGPADSLEAKIEGAVLTMFAADALRADVLRLEYDAGSWFVTQRRGIEDYEPEGIGQFEKAHALGVSLRTYKSRLAEAREKIATLLGVQ